MIVGLFRIGMDYGEFLEDFYVKKREIELFNFNLRMQAVKFYVKFFFFLFNLSLRIHTTYIYFTCTF